MKCCFWENTVSDILGSVLPFITRSFQLSGIQHLRIDLGFSWFRVLIVFLNDLLGLFHTLLDITFGFLESLFDVFLDTLRDMGHDPTSDFGTTELQPSEPDLPPKSFNTRSGFALDRSTNTFLLDFLLDIFQSTYHLLTDAVESFFPLLTIRKGTLVSR